LIYSGVPKEILSVFFSLRRTGLGPAANQIINNPQTNPAIEEDKNTEGMRSGFKSILALIGEIDFQKKQKK